MAICFNNKLSLIKKGVFALFLLLTVLYFSPLPVMAQNAADSAINMLDQTVKPAIDPATQPTVPELMAFWVTLILSIVGVLFLILVIYGGITWMTAGGNEEKVTKARQRMTRAAIGLIITISAYVLTTFVLSKLQNVQTTPEQTDNACTGTCLDIGTCYPPAHTQDGACQDGQECCSQ